MGERMFFAFSLRTGLWWATVAGALALSPGQGQANDFDRSLKALLKSAYDNLQTATACESVIGSSHYWEARAVVENALRAAGYSAAGALSQTQDFSREVKRSMRSRPPTDFAECLAKFSRTSKDLLRRQCKIRERQERCSAAKSCYP